MEFLPQQNRDNWGDEDVAALHPEKKKIWADGKKVIVIGGGDTGSDCIGTSLRQGATQVDQLRTAAQAARRTLRPATPGRSGPASQLVSRGNDRFGGEVAYSILTKRFIGENGKVTGLQTVDLAWEGRQIERN